MAKQTLTTIKNWFKTSLKPTQQQFWDTWDSFWHKDEQIPSSTIDGLDDALASKATTEALTTTNQAVANNTNAISNKVDKIDGKGLSSEDFTAIYKTKLENIEEGAEVNVQSDWSQADDTLGDFIKNKPDLSVFQESSSQLVTWDTGAAQPTSDADYVIGEYVEEGLTYLVTRYVLDNGKTIDVIDIVDAASGGFTPSVASSVGVVAVDAAGNIYVGGQFPGLIRKLDPFGEEDTSFTANLPAFVAQTGYTPEIRTIKINVNGSLFVGGAFSRLIKKLNADGTEDTSFISAITENFCTLQSLVVNGDGSLVVGGDFTEGLMKLTDTGAKDSAFSANLTTDFYSVFSIYLQSDGTLLIGGNFSGSLRKLNADGTEVTSFTANLPSLSGEIYSINANQDSSIIIGGAFTGYLKKLNTDGTEVTSFAINLPSIDFNVANIAINSDSTLLIGGAFSGSLRKLNADGTEVTSFTANLPSLSASVSSINVNQDSSIIIGGAFTGYLKKLNADGSEISGVTLTNYVLESLRNKVDKVQGKQLSTEDFTTAEKSIVDNQTGIDEIAGTDLDFSGKNSQHITLTAATALTFSNLVAGKKINLVADGNFAITWPAYVIDAGGTIGATKTVYELICTNSTTGSEEVWVRIIGAE